MKSEKEIRETLEKVDRITGFIGDCGTGEELNHERVAYGCAVSDFVSWIFDDRFSSDDFLSEDYVDMPLLEKMAKDIEARTGKKLKDYN